MFAKKSLVVLVVLLFTIGVTALGFAAENVKGSISRIQDNQITIQDALGKEKTIGIANPDTLKDLKVGDKIALQDGMLIMFKEGARTPGLTPPTPPSAR